MKRRKTGKAAFTQRNRRNKRAAPARPQRAPLAKPKTDFINMLIAAHAQALGLTIDPGWRGGVKLNLGLILRLGGLVDDFALPDDIEPGPVFHA
jgi:hypothetical protein